MLDRLTMHFRLGILAGMLIGIGGALNLSISSNGQPIIGAIFFSFGLMCVCLLGASLFTGKVGYVLEKDKNYALDVLVMSIGNIVGALAVGYICGLIFPSWTVNLTSKFLYGEGTSWWACLLLSMGAGAFVYLAVECFRIIPSYPAKLIMVCLSIASMVLLGCNHSIANVFYFAYGQITIAGFDAAKAIFSVMVAMVGNSIGSICLYSLQKSIPFFKKKEKTKENE